MQEFPPNSRKAAARAEEPKRVEQVTSGETRKRGLSRKFKDTFIGGDARGTAQYVFFAVLIPSAKDMLAEAAQTGIERLIYGESARPRRGAPPPGYSATGSVNYTPYNRMGPSTGSRPSQGRPLSQASRTRHNFDEIVIPTRQEAEEVLDRMYELLSKYGSVSVSDLYELTGIQSGHTDYKWGWTELRGSRVDKLRAGGYLLDVPAPVPLG